MPSIESPAGSSSSNERRVPKAVNLSNLSMMPPAVSADESRQSLCEKSNMGERQMRSGRVDGGREEILKRRLIEALRGGAELSAEETQELNDLLHSSRKAACSEASKRRKDDGDTYMNAYTKSAPMYIPVFEKKAGVPSRPQHVSVSLSAPPTEEHFAFSTSTSNGMPPVPTPHGQDERRYRRQDSVATCRGPGTVTARILKTLGKEAMQLIC